jgi:hypothetical protein
LDPLQQILIETFKIPASSPAAKKVSADLRLTYAKYLAIQRMIEDVGEMERAATWTHKKPTVQDIVEIYMSRSGYFNRPHKFFPKVQTVSSQECWNGWRVEEMHLTQSDVWGDKKPSFKNLK